MVSFDLLLCQFLGNAAVRFSLLCWSVPGGSVRISYLIMYGDDYYRLIRVRSPSSSSSVAQRTTSVGRRQRREPHRNNRRRK